MLSIDPRAQNLRLYSRQIGDWPYLGEIKWGSNITIPIMAASPDGTPRSVNVSVIGYKNSATHYLNQTVLVSNQNITGIGEIRFSSSLLVSKGEYSFAIKTDEIMEEWKWPFVTLRGYLVDGETGEVFYASDFRSLDIREYRSDSPQVTMTRIRQDARNDTSGFIINGVLVGVDEANPFEWGCEVWNTTDNLNTELQQYSMFYGILRDYSPDNNGFFFYNSTSQVLYRNSTCWFNISAPQTTYQKGNFISINKEGRVYNLTVLTIDRDVFNYNNWTDSDVNFTLNDCQSFGQTPAVAVFDVSNVSHTVPSDSFNWTSTTICINSSAWAGGIYNISYQWLGRSWRADFGPAGVDHTVILPMVNNPFADPQWSIEWSYIYNLSIFGTYYDVILANDTTAYHPRCMVEPSPDGQCANRAWMVQTSIGNFSDPQTVNATVGQNFTLNLYLASIGPNDGDGIVIGNFSLLPNLGPMKGPAAGGFPLADNALSRLVLLNESTIGYDLDRNASAINTFYMLAFDSDFNNQQTLTSNMVDDDLEFLPWSYNNGSQDIIYDNTQLEYYAYGNRTAEQWCDLPSGINNGCARFGDEYPDTQWENQPNWDVPFFNNTHMILRKQRWSFNSGQTVDFLSKVFNFNQSAIAGANVSVVSVARATWSGFQIIPSSNYTVDKTFNRTDAYGYSLLKISPLQIGSAPANTWADGNYQVLLNIQAPSGNEIFERWFCVGSCNQ